MSRDTTVQHPGAMVTMGRNPFIAMMLLLAVGGCSVDPQAARQWQSRVLPPRPPTLTTFEPRTPHGASDDGYCLYLCVDARGIDFSSWAGLIRTLGSRPGNKLDPSSGHSWIALRSPNGVLFRGHTGNEGLLAPTYAQRFGQLNDQDHPNPILALHGTQADGRQHGLPEDREPTFVLRIAITRQEHDRLRTFIETYPYSEFSVREHQCTDFVVQAAWQVGLTPANRIECTLPAEADVWGRRLRFWHDPKYRVITFGSPDVLAMSLQELAAQGLGNEATDELRQLLRAAEMAR